MENVKYFFDVAQDIYIPAISRPGYEDFEQEINIGLANSVLKHQKYNASHK